MSKIRHSASAGASSLAFMASLLACGATHAGEPAKKLVLSVYTGTDGAESALAGRYDATIRQLGAHGGYSRTDLVAASTNLCVAYIMTRQWDAARSSCDSAVVHAKVASDDRVLDSGRNHNARLAVAYSNRAVLNWLQNKPEQAAADASRASSLAPRTELGARNGDMLTRLSGNPATPAGPAVAAIQR